MKRIRKCKNSLLSLLLLSFAFLVVHDFVMPVFESVQAHQSTTQEQQINDLCEDIHETIHAIVAPDVLMHYAFLQQRIAQNQAYKLTLNDSENLCVLERPPLQ